jgi:hypothetical protein
MNISELLNLAYVSPPYEIIDYKKITDDIKNLHISTPKKTKKQTNKLNKGELSECKVKCVLLSLKNSGQSLNNVFKRITKLENFPNNEIKNLDFKITDLDDSDSLYDIFKSCNISKKGGGFKADVYINGIGISLKSLNNAKPSLINHTHRGNFIRVCNKLKIDINILDKCIKEYHQLRHEKKIMEDVNNSDDNSPFSKIKTYFIKILKYFLFEGTGTKDSKQKAEYIIFTSSDNDIKKWYIISKESTIFFDKMWEHLTFSIRHKAMPKNYPNIDQNKFKKISKWTEIHQGKYKGSLHVRLSTNIIDILGESLKFDELSL